MILRFVYTKTEYMKFLGHLELMRFFERAFRRLNLPLQFTEGFNPHPKMTFGGPLSVGVGSLYEVMEVEIDHPINYDDFIVRFNASAPKGLSLVSYAVVGKSQSLMSALRLATYQVTITRSEGSKPYDLHHLFNAQPEIILRKKNKKNRWVDKDLKPFVQALALVSADREKEVYNIAVYSSSDGSAKPSEVVALLIGDREDFDVDAVEILRTGLFYEDEGVYKLLATL